MFQRIRINERDISKGSKRGVAAFGNDIPRICRTGGFARSPGTPRLSTRGGRLGNGNPKIQIMPKAESKNGQYITGLLNRIEAMIDCGAGRTSELAGFLRPGDDKAETRVGEWIRSRRRTPNGEMTLRLHEWAEKKTLLIAKSRKLATAYRAAFKAVTEKSQ